METIGIVLIRCGLSDFTAWRLKLLGAVLRIEDARWVFRDVLQGVLPCPGRICGRVEVRFVVLESTTHFSSYCYKE